MDLTSLNQPSAARPDGYDDLRVETRVAFDENNRPIYVVVPVESRTDGTMVHVPVPQYGHAVAHQAVYQPVSYYSAPPSAPSTYNVIHDPIVCRLLAGTVAVVGCAFSLSFVLAALAAATTALGFLLGILALIWMLSSGSGGSGKVSVQITNSNRSKHRG